MKKKLSIIISFTLFGFVAEACDICGCGAGSYYVGILPEFNQKIIGLRYRHNSLLTHIGAGGQSSYLTSNETYRTAELWGGWTIGKKFRVMGYIPVSVNEKMNQGHTRTKTGMGDIGFQGFYQLLNNRRTAGKHLLVQGLWLGAGVKLPTGNYDAGEKNNQESANIFQLGTGSIDFTLNAMYDIRLQDAGMNITTSYKINTSNKANYSYGNRFSLAAQFYYKFRFWDRFTLAPNVGILYETAEQDKDGHYTMNISGGNMLLGTAGGEISFSKFAIGANFQNPLLQNLANGFVKAGNRAMVHLSLPLQLKRKK